MDIHAIIAAFKAGEGDKEEVGEALLNAPVKEKHGGWAAPKEEFVPAAVAPVAEVKVPETVVVPVVVEPVPVVAPTIKKVHSDKRGRPVLYDTTNLKVGEFVVYEGKLSSARVYASLKGDKETGLKFQATETDGVIRITRKG